MVWGEIEQFPTTLMLISRIQPHVCPRFHHRSWELWPPHGKNFILLFVNQLSFHFVLFHQQQSYTQATKTLTTPRESESSLFMDFHSSLSSGILNLKSYFVQIGGGVVDFPFSFVFSSRLFWLLRFEWRKKEEN